MTKHEMTKQLDDIDSTMEECWRTTKIEEMPDMSDVELFVKQREALYIFMSESRKLVSIMKELVDGK